MPTYSQPLTLYLDGLDQLSSDYGELDFDWLPRNLPDHVSIIVSVTSEPRNRAYAKLKVWIHVHE